VAKGGFERWTRQLVRRGIREGLIEGSDVWLSIAAIVWLFRFLSRRPRPQVSVARLRVGESIVVSHVPPPPRSRRGRKKAAREAAKREAREADDRAKRETRQARQRAKREASRRYARDVAKAAEAKAAAEAKQARKAARTRGKRRSRVGEGPTERYHSEEDGEESA